jgi:hypothetical protein
MLSTRGQAYASSGLMEGYVTPTKRPYHKTSNPDGEVSFAMAENVSFKSKPNYFLIHFADFISF